MVARKLATKFGEKAEAGGGGGGGGGGGVGEAQRESIRPVESRSTLRLATLSPPPPLSHAPFCLPESVTISMQSG